MLTAVEQHITDSCLFYFFGDSIKNFSSNLFTILQTQTYETEKFLVKTHIIGQSHFFTITDKPSQKIIAVEGLACVPMPKSIPTIAHSFAHLQPFSFSFALQNYGLEISSSAEIVSNMPMDKKRWQETLDCAKIFMEYSFPGDLSPQTLFSLEEGTNFFRVQTLHEFEEKNSLISLVTKTKVTLL